MTLYENELYKDDVTGVASLELPWEKLRGKKLMLSGATGLIGSFLIDVIMKKNEDGLNCTVYALGRSEERMKSRFKPSFFESGQLVFVKYDVKEALRCELMDVDYILHLASNTHPLQYATEPISTITTNVIGLKNMLDFAVDHGCSRFAFASSNEVYGENRGDTEFFDEDYVGYINSNTLRAGYPESKRCGEALCQAYMAEKGLDTVIPRLTRTYGPTMLLSDTKAISQFIKKALNGEDIVLKSEGNQFYSYTYVADAVSGLLTVLLVGESGHAYNIADAKSDITLKDLAGILAKYAGRKVVFELPDSVEASGYSKATKARLDGTKLKKIGWNPGYDIETGLTRTLSILSSLND